MPLRGVGRMGKQVEQEEGTGGAGFERPRAPFVPNLAIPAPPSARKTISARYTTVKPKFMQPSWRQIQDSSRAKLSSRSQTAGSARIGSARHGSGEGSSVAANVAAGRNTRMKHRFQPTVEDISRALRDRPYLINQICAIRDDPTLDKVERMAQIGKVVQECEAPVKESDLDKQQATYAPSRERMNGRRAAHKVYGEYVKNVIKTAEPIVDASAYPIWREHGGEEVGQMLQYVDLVDARYLIALSDAGGNLPCWGALPDTARINRSNMWRLYGWQARGCLPCLAVSYPWLDFSHPDSEGETLARIVPVLRAMLPLCGGEQFTIGVLIDYASLPQPTRTHAELTRFKLGLRALTTWFAHPYVPTLLVSNSLPKGGDYQNTRSVSERGWIEFERRLTYLAKSRPCLWDLAGLKLQALEEQTDARRKFDLMRSMMMTHTSPPLAPSSFTLMMQKKIKDGRLSFSNKGDLKVVLDMYHAAFVKIFEIYQRCDPSAQLATYCGHQWGEEEARSVAAALEYAAQKCKVQQTSGPIIVNLEGNHFGDMGERLIKAAVKFGKIFMGVRF